MKWTRYHKVFGSREKVYLHRIIQQKMYHFHTWLNILSCNELTGLGAGAAKQFLKRNKYAQHVEKHVYTHIKCWAHAIPLIMRILVICTEVRM